MVRQRFAMSADRHTKQFTMLDAEEASLRASLLAILPGVAAGGTQIFLNSMNSPENTSRYSHEAADELFKSAQRCGELRDNLGISRDGCVADQFFIACQEAASGDANRRGPRKLAEWLLSKITS
jgi:hypothetical protein